MTVFQTEHILSYLTIYKIDKTSNDYDIHHMVGSMTKGIDRPLYMDIEDDDTKVLFLRTPELPGICNDITILYQEKEKEVNTDIGLPYVMTVRVSPQIRKRDTGKLHNMVSPGQDVGVVVHDWLMRKSELNGFRIIPNTLNITKRKHVYSSNGTMIPRVDVECVIKITDCKKFKSVIGGGLGRGKSYGCGMILLQ